MKLEALAHGRPLKIWQFLYSKYDLDFSQNLIISALIRPYFHKNHKDAFISFGVIRPINSDLGFCG